MVSRCYCTRNRKGLSFLLLLQLLLSSGEGRSLEKDAPPSSSTQVQRIVRKLSHPAQEEEEEMMARSRIGSRPPSCERRCATCGHCEAVQVPAVPQQRRKDLSSRADDTSNYKPVSWKCQCGGLITDP